MSLHSYYTTTCNGSKYIAATFNIINQRTIHIICVYTSCFCLISIFFNTLEALIQKSPNDCPFILLGDFNIDILDDSICKNNKQQWIEFMKKFELKSQFKNITKKSGSQLDHIRSNEIRNECK
jgi:hypothetical protein